MKAMLDNKMRNSSAFRSWIGIWIWIYLDYDYEVSVYRDREMLGAGTGMDGVRPNISIFGAALLHLLVMSKDWLLSR